MAPHAQVIPSAHAAEASGKSRLKVLEAGKKKKMSLPGYAAMLKLLKEEVAKTKDKISRDYMFALMKAVDKDQYTLSNMEITDAKSAELDATIETDIYKYFNGPNGVLTNDAKHVAADAKYAKEHPKGKNPRWNGGTAGAQAKYNADSSEASAAEQQQDGAVQNDQGQTSADASNLQMKAQMIQGINSILSTLTSLLGKVTA